MSQAPASIDFRANSQRVPATMPAAVQKATGKFLGNRAALVDQLGQDLWQKLRQAGHDLRVHALMHLDAYLTQAEEAVTEGGGPRALGAGRGGGPEASSSRSRASTR